MDVSSCASASRRLIRLSVAVESSKPSRLLAYAQLMRLPNVFTAMADVFMGYWLTHETLAPVGVFLLLLASSSCLYTAGMVINDLFDLEQDRRERPERPLPSGRVSKKSATLLGTLLMTLGIAFCWYATLLTRTSAPSIIGTALAGIVVFYNRVAKRTAWGPIFMGLCRTLNVLLGMSTVLWPLRDVQGYVAAGIGVYIIGITWFARTEAAISARSYLLGGCAIMLSSIVALWWYPQLLSKRAIIPTFRLHPGYWTLLWIELTVLLSLVFVRAIIRPDQRRVQTAVKIGIFSIIAIDALVIFAVHGPLPAAMILLLLVPTIILGRWVYST